MLSIEHVSVYKTEISEYNLVNIYPCPDGIYILMGISQLREESYM